jgi:uncharacterized protein YndB with AHSA1/START domain
MKPVRATRHIAAPPQAVFDVILDVDRYPEWNPFTPRMTVRTDEMAVGKEFDLDCQMAETQLLEGEREVVLALDREKLHFCMGTSRSRGRPGIKSFRWQKCEPAPDGGTAFENYESFHGPLGPIVWLLFRKRLEHAFEKYCVALEERVLHLSRRPPLSTSAG